MNREIKTKQQLIEKLNEIDKKCIDEGLHFHDLKTLYEAKEYKLSAQDKADIKKVAAIEDDPDTLKAYIDSKAMEEDLEEDFEDDNVIEYRGFYIEHNFYGGDEYTVQYCGDDVEFNSVEDAKRFIDEVSEQDGFYEDYVFEESLNEVYYGEWEKYGFKNYNEFNNAFKAWCEKQYYKGFNPDNLDISDREYDELQDAFVNSLTSLKETLLSPEEEYDYFNVYCNDALVGEFPTYASALEKAQGCNGENVVINGVIQYGGEEFEETPIIREVINETYDYGNFVEKNGDGLIIPFNYFIFFDSYAFDSDYDGYFPYGEPEGLFLEEENELEGFLNSQEIYDKIKKEIDLDIEEIFFSDSSILDTEIKGYLEVSVDGIESISNDKIEQLLNLLNNLLSKWDHKTIIEMYGKQRDVDDWDDWEEDVDVLAELDYCDEKI